MGKNPHCLGSVLFGFWDGQGSVRVLKDKDTKISPSHELSKSFSEENTTQLP